MLNVGQQHHLITDSSYCLRGFVTCNKVHQLNCLPFCWLTWRTLQRNHCFA